MKYNGNLLKMRSENADTVQYRLVLGDEEIDMNALIGKELRISYDGTINCIKCGRKTKTSFAQGYCYPCFISAPETEECVLRPELCQAHNGIARDMEFAKNHCLIEHYVYLAISGGLKVGVTRNTQIPTRWIDQGAIKAIIIASAPNRYLAGSIEIELKKYFNDKTNWRNMLTNKLDLSLDLLNEKKRAIENLQEDLKVYAYPDDSITQLNYPVEQYPEKVKSINLDKLNEFSDVLSGIKGQYLLFVSGSVMNIRKHNGYMVEMEVI